MDLSYYKDEVKQWTFPFGACATSTVNQCDTWLCASRFMADSALYANEIHRISLLNGATVNKVCDAGSNITVSMNVTIILSCQTPVPTLSPTKSTDTPTNIPTTNPTDRTENPTTNPTDSTGIPTNEPTMLTTIPTNIPSINTISPTITTTISDSLNTGNKTLVLVIVILSVVLILLIVCFSLCCSYKIRKYKSTIETMSSSLKSISQNNLASSQPQIETPKALPPELSMLLFYIHI